MKLTKEQKQFISILTQSLGILSLALQQSEITEEEYEDWMDDMEFEMEVQKIQSKSLDFVENQLMKKVRDGDINAIKYYLSTKGKDRGYK